MSENQGTLSSAISRENSDESSGELLQMITPGGLRVSAGESDVWVADVTTDDLIALYEDLVIVRRIDVEATALQRQGELGLWPPLLGQEAAQVGSARALRTDDFVFSSYRENAVAWCRGVDLGDLLRAWRGIAHAGWNPYAIGMAPPTIIIGAQTLHATGWALGAKFDGTDSVAIAYFGDGAMSEGDVSEAFVFAASYRAPVVFFCQNNQWAISEPVRVQAVLPLADRAPGFGVPSIRVDGNDVLAVLAATRIALDRARRGGGPTFIEAVTYRMGPHTTADDPTRYRDAAELEEWKSKDPILRLKLLLQSQNLFTPELEGRIEARTDAVAAELRERCITLPEPDPLTIFDDVYATPFEPLVEQRAEYAEYLASFEVVPVDGVSS